MRACVWARHSIVFVCLLACCFIIFLKKTALGGVRGYDMTDHSSQPIFYLAIEFSSTDEDGMVLAACFGAATGTPPYHRFHVSFARENATDALRGFLTWCHTLAVQYEELGANTGVIKVVSSEPDLDIGPLGTMGTSLGVWPKPIRFLGTERSHSLVIPSERLYALKAHAACTAWIADAYPEVLQYSDDADARATHLYTQCIYLNRVHRVS